MASAYVALGSNLENPALQIRQAFDALARMPGSMILQTSSLYQTAPNGYDAAQLALIPDFINAVAHLETTLSPQALLTHLLAIEQEAGRQRPYHFAPRVLDCDLLLYDDVVMYSDNLTLPHPRMHQRGFVLIPLNEINPAIHIPHHGTVAENLKRMNVSDVMLYDDHVV